MKKSVVTVLLFLLASSLLISCGGGDVTRSVAPNEKAITAFSFSVPLHYKATGIIDENSKAISVPIPLGTDLTRLIANFTTTGIAVYVEGFLQISGTTVNNFTSPVIYTVTASDGSTVQYTVSVTVFDD